MRPPERRRARPKDLREACVAEAFRIVEERGVETLSLREVARRLGVSHQAPYKHFASRDHILAEIVARCFDEFSRVMEARPPAASDVADLAQMGRLYLDFAARHPLRYRLMFNTALPEPDKHPAMLASARRAFDLLRGRLTGMALAPLAEGRPSPAHDALFVWATLHGLASILPSPALATLGLSESEIAAAPPLAMARVGLALHGPGRKV